MTDKKISEFTDGTPAQATDMVPVVRDNSDWKVTAQSVADLFSQSLNQAYGVDEQVQFNDNGVFAGNASLTFDKTAEELYAKNIVAVKVTAPDVWAGGVLVFAGVGKLNDIASPVTCGIGARAIVTDAIAEVFNSAVANGGALTVPVYSNGAIWIIG